MRSLHDWTLAVGVQSALVGTEELALSLPFSRRGGSNGKRPVVKAFNNIEAASLLEKSRPEGAAGRIAVPVAGDPPAGRAKVMRLVENLGFDAVDTGGLADSWRRQPATPPYVQDFDEPRLRDALAAADRSRISEYRRASNEAASAYFQQRLKPRPPGESRASDRR